MVYYLLSFRDPKENKPVTLKVKTIGDSNLGISFIRISDFIFDTKGTIVDPNEENLRLRYLHTKSLHISIYSIISIEEVGADHPGLRFDLDKSKLLILRNELPN